MKTITARSLLALGLLGLAACSASTAPKSEFSDTPASTLDQAPAPTPSASSTTDPAPTPVATNPAGSGETISASIDPAQGGSIVLSDGARIDVPKDALPPGVTELSITSSPFPAPSEYESSSPLYVFGPDGTVFQSPITVSFPIKVANEKQLADLVVLWSRHGAEGYDMVPTDFQKNDKGEWMAMGVVTHFSTGMCGKRYKKDPHPPKDPYGDEQDD